MPNTQTLVITREWLEEQYVQRGMSAHDIGKMAGLSRWKVFRLLEKYGIPKRQRGGWNAAKLVEEEYGRLRVVKAGPRKHGRPDWECVCACGSTVIVQTGDLLSGHTQSCGCYASEVKTRSRWKGVGEISGDYWGSLQRSAAARSIPFAITIEEAWDLYVGQGGRCAMTGLPIHFSRSPKRHKRQQTASLDRKNPLVGYVPGNVQWVHKTVNRVKQNLQQDEFISLCSLVVAHRKSESPVVLSETDSLVA